MERKFNRKILEKRFPFAFESMYAIMEYEFWEASELEKRWIKDNLKCSICDIVNDFNLKDSDNDSWTL